MVKVYNSSNIIEAQIVRGMLEAHDIKAYVGGQYLQGGVGELASMDFASVSVDDENIALAQELIKEYEEK